VIGVICPWEKKERRKREILFFSFFLQKAREEEGKAKNAGKPSGSFVRFPLSTPLQSLLSQRKTALWLVFRQNWTRKVQWTTSP